jgi:hypothetical protein
MSFGAFPKGEMEDIAVMEIICDKIFNCDLIAKVAKFYAMFAMDCNFIPTTRNKLLKKSIQLVFIEAETLGLFAGIVPLFATILQASR